MVDDSHICRQQPQLTYIGAIPAHGETPLHSLLTKYPWLEWLSYGLLLAALFGPAVIDPNAVIGADVDLRGTLWYYWWFKGAVLSGGSTELTELFCYPYGVDIHAQTGGNFIDALLSIPFQMVLGTPGYFSVFVMALFAANTAAFRSLMTTLEVSPLARWVSTLLWMLNPFVLHELIWGRPTQAMLFFSILAIRSFWLLHKAPHIKHALWLGLWVAMQGLTYWYAGYFLAFVLGWMALCLFKQASILIGWRTLLKYYAASVGTCVAGLSYPVSRILSKASTGAIPTESIVSGSWLVPDSLSNYVGGYILGYQVTEGHGYPMLHSWLWGPLLIAVFVVGRKRKLWAGLILLTLAVATGPEWTIGNTLFRMPQYMALYHVLPFFERLWFPYRILGFTFIALSVAAALLFDKYRHLKWALPVAGLALMAGLGESIQLKSAPLLSTIVRPSPIATHIRDNGGPVLNVPFDSGDASVVLQVIHGQPILSGMGENSPYFKPAEHLERMETNTFLRYLDEIVREPDEEREFTAADRATIEAQGFRWVILFRDQVLATQARFSNDPQDGDAAPVQFNDIRFKSAFDIQRAMSEHFGPALMVDGEHVLWDLANPQTESCCKDEYKKTWTEFFNPHFGVLERMGRTLTNKMDHEGEVIHDPNAVPPDPHFMHHPGGPGEPPPQGPPLPRGPPPPR